MVQKHGVNRLTHRVVAAKTKADVADATRHLCAGQVVFNPTRGVDKVHRVVVVLFNAGGNGENIWVKNDVFWWKTQLIDQHPVGALANFNFSFVGVGLPFFVKSHDNGRRAVPFKQLGLVFERLQPLFHRD